MGTRKPNMPQSPCIWQEWEPSLGQKTKPFVSWTSLSSSSTSNSDSRSSYSTFSSSSLKSGAYALQFSCYKGTNRQTYWACTVHSFYLFTQVCPLHNLCMYILYFSATTKKAIKTHGLVLLNTSLDSAAAHNLIPINSSKVQYKHGKPCLCYLLQRCFQICSLSLPYSCNRYFYFTFSNTTWRKLLIMWKRENL